MVRPVGSDIRPRIPAICPICPRLPRAPLSTIMRTEFPGTMCSVILLAMSFVALAQSSPFWSRYSSWVKSPIS